MERFLQYLDNIDDLAGVFGLLQERFRRLFFRLLRAVIGLLVMAAAFWLTISHPVAALATCAVLIVVLGLRLLAPGIRQLLNSPKIRS
ncbi:MAG: hypothetical protein WBM87_10525 [Woeseiaceae bacterium]